MANDNLDGYSAEVLEKAPGRVTKLLNGIGAVTSIRTLMRTGSMTDDDIVEGRTLLLACLAAPLGQSPAKDTDDARAQREATAELDQWDEPNFGRHAAALRRKFRNAGEYVFNNLSASTGPAAVTGVATFLQRVDALEKGSDPAREASKKDDKRAVELLATRGLDKKERARLRSLVDVALGPTAELPAGAAEEDAASAARRKALVALQEWYEDWSSAARAVVKKRGYLIRLGLASRKVAKKKVKGKGGESPISEPK